MFNRDILQPSPDSNISHQTLELLALYEERLRERQWQLNEEEIQQYVEEFRSHPDVSDLPLYQHSEFGLSGAEDRGDIRDFQSLPPRTD